MALARGVRADVGDAEPAAAGGGQRDADVADRGAGQRDGGELAGAGGRGDDGTPGHAVGAGGDGVAARVVAGRGARVEDDLAGGDGPAEVSLEVLARGLAGAGGVTGARVAVHRAGRRVGARVRGRGPALRADLAQRV